MNETHQSLEEILFNLAVQKATAAERAAFLDHACRDNPTLRAAVEALLESHFGAEGFLPRLASGPNFPEARTVAAAASEVPAEVIGRYKLLEKIGEGGFGEVWMAEQREPVKRRVALKILKPGMDSRQIVARFEAERQALAMMDHPNIARIYDAGTTGGSGQYSVTSGQSSEISGQSPVGAGQRTGREPLTTDDCPLTTASGRPYFVMELVRGIKITEYCDQHQLPTQARLDLFIQVCNAIQHAHQKGIIHRDIKPSNVLVTVNDGAAVPKVIDFGIAKATQGELTDKTVFTQFQQFIGTPAYISPEQAEMSSLDIDTRADIYSLGVLLYELLVGQTPFDAREMMKGGLDALRKIIREQEPQRPSTKLNTLPGDARTTAGKRRQTDSVKLVHQLQGDLDWIVMKCLEKDRTRRYDTANGLAADLQRHLANEPVVARPPSTAYRFQKAFRRNKLVFTAGAVVGIALLLGVGVSTWQAIVASRARQQEARANDQLRVQVGETEQARQAAEKAAVAESQQRVRAEELLQAIQFQKADDLLANGPSVPGITLLGQMLRENPSNAVAASRFVSALLVAGRPQLTEPLRHQGPVTFAEFSPDGQRVVTASSDGTARVWDVRSGQALTGPLRHQTNVFSARFSPDGKRIVTASGDGTARVWDARSGQALTEPLHHEDFVTFAGFSPDGQWVVTASADRTARVWDARSGQPLTEPLRHQRDVRSARFSPDGKRIVTASGDGTARVWDARSGQAVTEPLRHEKVVWSAEFSPDSLRVVTASWDQTARLWDARSGQPLAEPLRHDDQVLSVRFSPDGQRVVTTSGLTAQVWDVRSGQALTGPLRHENAINSVRFSQDGHRVATASFDGTARVWDAHSSQPLSEPLRHGGTVWAAEFSPDGQRLVTASDDGTARVWDLRPDLPLTGRLRHQRFVTSAAFSPDGQRVVTASLDRTARVWDARSGQPLTQPLRHGHMVVGPRFSPNGQQVVTLSLANGAAAVHHWDSRSGRPLGEPISVGDGTTRAELSPDAQRIVLVSVNGAAWVRDALTGEALTPPLRDEAAVESAEFSPDGQRLVTRSQDHSARVWDVRSGQALTGPLRHDSELRSARFSPDGQRVVTVAGTVARVWDARSGQPLLEPLRHEDDVASGDFSPDGQRLVTASGNNARIWDARSGLVLTESLRHETTVNAARFSPDGRRVVTASGNTVRVWDARSGQPLTGSLRHDDKVIEIQFSPDGTRVLATSHDNVARVWEVPAVPVPAPAWFLDWAEAHVGRRFDPRSTAGAIPLTEIRRQQELAAARADGDFYTRIAQWSQADPATRTLSPHTTWSAAEYLRGQIEEDTVASLREAVQIAPTNALAWARLALAELGQDRREDPARWIKAGHSARQAVRWDPLNSEGWLAQAAVELRTGQTNQSMVSVEKSLQLDPTNRGAWVLKGRLLTQGGRPAEALAAYRNVLTELPTEPVTAFQACKELLQKHLETLAPSGRPQEPGAGQQKVVRWMVEEVLIQSRRLPTMGLEGLLERREPLEPQLPLHSLAVSCREAGFAAEGDRLNAAGDEGLRRLATAQPGNLWPAMRIAALDAWFGREREYAATCDAILETVRNTRDPNRAERASKLASLVPTDDQTREAALVLAHRAVELGEGEPRFGLMQLALGMAEYRSGHWLEAEQVLLAAPKSGTPSPNPNVVIPAAFFRAMALFRQDKRAEARQILAETSAAMTPLPTDPKNPLADGVDDGVLIHWIAHREATALIGAEATPAPSSKP